MIGVVSDSGGSHLIFHCLYLAQKCEDFLGKTFLYPRLQHPRSCSSPLILNWLMMLLVIELTILLLPISNIVILLTEISAFSNRWAINRSLPFIFLMCIDLENMIASERKILHLLLSQCLKINMELP